MSIFSSRPVHWQLFVWPRALAVPADTCNACNTEWQIEAHLNSVYCYISDMMNLFFGFAWQV